MNVNNILLCYWLSVSSVNPMFIFFLICRKLGVLGGWGGEAYLGANSGVGYFGEAYSYITVPITCSHQLKKKKKAIAFPLGEWGHLFCNLPSSRLFPSTMGNMVEMPEGIKQERAHPARASSGLPPLCCTTQCLTEGQLQMLLQSICRSWYKQWHFT